MRESQPQSSIISQLLLTSRTPSAVRYQLGLRSPGCFPCVLCRETRGASGSADSLTHSHRLLVCSPGDEY